MSALRNALEQYVAFQGAFGTTYREPAQTLGDFVDFLAREGAEFITTPLALRWAMTPQGVQHATWARRLSMVRLFAQWLSAIDPRTEVRPDEPLQPDGNAIHPTFIPMHKSNYFWRPPPNYLRPRACAGRPMRPSSDCWLLLACAPAKRWRSTGRMWICKAASSRFGSPSSASPAWCR